MTGGGIATSYTYDDLGRQQTEIDSAGFLKAYTHDPHHNQKTFILKKDGITITNTTYAS